MSELVPMTFPTGVTANVADIKVGKLKKYLDVFPHMRSIDRVYLFGSTLEERCREDSDIDFMLFYNERKAFRQDMADVLPEIFPDFVYDDFLRAQSKDPRWFPTGAARVALEKGVLIYERIDE